MASARRRRKRRGHHDESEHADERWLLTYSDMITLLMALFMVLFSISSVNTSKFESLQRALQDAFSGKVLPGGKSIQAQGDSDDAHPTPARPPIAAITVTAPAATAEGRQASERAAAKEEEDFFALKRRLEEYARRNGLAKVVEVRVDRRGLVVRLLTDGVLFDSGQAAIKPGARGLLAETAHLLKGNVADHTVIVEGHTDDVPIRTGRFPTNWELSTTRAASVVRFLIGEHVGAYRLGAMGFADRHPVASNATQQGRARNRRVEIVIPRTGGQGGRTAP